MLNFMIYFSGYHWRTSKRECFTSVHCGFIRARILTTWTRWVCFKNWECCYTSPIKHLCWMPNANAWLWRNIILDNEGFCLRSGAFIDVASAISVNLNSSPFRRKPFWWLCQYTTALGKTEFGCLYFQTGKKWGICQRILKLYSGLPPTIWKLFFKNVS